MANNNNTVTFEFKVKRDELERGLKDSISNATALESSLGDMGSTAKAAFEKVQSAAAAAGSGIGQAGVSADEFFNNVQDAFRALDEMTALHTAELQKLEAEYQALDVAKEAALQAGDEREAMAARQNALKEEIAARKQLLTEIGEQTTALTELERRVIAEAQQYEEGADVIEQFTTKIRKLKSELAQMNYDKSVGIEIDEAKFESAKEEIGRLTDAMSDATAQANIMAHDQRGFQGVISGLSGVSGAFSAATGFASLFAGENENLQKIMVKVQSLMALTVGLQQVQAVLDKDSAFRLATLNGLKQWWARITTEAAAAQRKETAAIVSDTVAKQGNAAATGAGIVVTKTGTVANLGLAGSFRAIGLAIKSIPVFGWVLAGASALVGVFSLLSSASRKVKEEQKELAEATKGVAQEYANEASKIKTLVMLLGSEKTALAAKIQAKAQLQGIVKDSNVQLDREGRLVSINTEAIKNYVAQLKVRMQLRIQEQRLEKQMAEQLEREERMRQLRTTIDAGATTTTKESRYVKGLMQSTTTYTREAQAAIREFNKLSFEAQEAEVAINGTVNAAAGLHQQLAGGRAEIKGTKEYWEMMLAEAEAYKATLNTETDTPAQFKAAQDRIDDFRAKLDMFTKAATEAAAASEKADDKAVDRLRQAREERLRLLTALAEKEIDIYDSLEDAKIRSMEEGEEKRLSILRREQDAEIAKINTWRQNYLKALSEAAGTEVTQLPEEMQKAYETLMSTVAAFYRKERAERPALKEYVSYTEELLRIEKKFGDDRTALEEERKKYAEHTQEYKIYTEKIANLIKTKQEAIARLMQDRPDIAALFGDLSSTSIAALKAAIEAGQKELENDGLGADQIKALKEGIAAATAMISKKNPWKALKEAAAEYKKVVQKGDGATPEEMATATSRFNSALSAAQGYMNEIFTAAGNIGQIIGQDWSEELGKVQTVINGVIGAFEKTGDSFSEKLPKITGLISAIAVAAQTAADMIDAKMNKSIGEAGAQAEKLSHELDKIMNKKGSGDSLFTQDDVNRGRQLLQVAQQASEGIQKTAQEFGRVYESQVRKLSSWIFRVLDPTDLVNKMLNVSSSKFAKQNEAALMYLRGLEQYNLESIADIDRALSDLNVAYAKTAGDVGRAHLDAVRSGLEKAKEAAIELDNLVKNMAGDIGDAIQSVILDSRKGVSSFITSTTKELNASFEQLAGKQIFAKMFGEAFDTFGEDFKKALTGTEKDMATVYANLFDTIMLGQGEFLNQMDKAAEAAGTVGLNIFGTEASGTLAQMEAEILSLTKIQERLNKLNAEYTQESLEALRTQADTIQQATEDAYEAARQNRLKEIAIQQELLDQTGQNSPERQTVEFDLRELQAQLSTLEATKADWFSEYEDLTRKIAEYEAAIRSGSNVGRITDELNDLIKKRDLYIQTVPYIEEQIAKQKELQLSQSTNAEQWAKYQAEIDKLEAQKAAIMGDQAKAAEELVQGSLSWLDKQLSDIETKLRSLSPDELIGETGLALKRQKEQFEQQRAELEAILGGSVTMAAAEGSRNQITELLNQASAELDALNVLDEANAARVAELQSLIAGYEVQLSAIEAFLSTEATQEATLKQLIDSEQAKYELYQKWLDIYGEEQANEMLSALLSNADTYLQKLNEGIAQMEEKALIGTATDEDLSQLRGWYDQRQSIYDAAARAAEEAAQKAMEAWTSGVDTALADAENAFDRIAALSGKLADLGASGLSSAQQDAERKRLDDLLQQEQRQLEKDLLREFETLENKKLRVAQEYERQIAWLREHGYTEEAALAAERAQEEIDSIENARIERLDIYKQGVKDIANMSLEEVRVFIASVRQIVQENEDLSQEAKEVWEDTFRDWENSAAKAADALSSDKFESAINGLNDVATAISAVSDLLSDMGVESDAVLGSLTNAASGVASILGGLGSGNWVGVFTGSLTVLTSVYTLVKSLLNDIDKKHAALVAQAKTLSSAYRELEYAIKNAIGTETAALQREQIANLARQQAVLLQQMATERGRKKPDQDAIDAWKQQAQDIQHQIEDIISGMRHDLLQTDVKTFAAGLADAVYDATKNMKSSFLSVEEFTAKSVQNILRNYLQLKYLEAPVQALLEELNADIQANGPTREAFEQFKKDAQAISASFKDVFDPWKDYFDVGDIDNQLKSAFATASEQSINALVGLANAMRVGQADQLLAIQITNQLLSEGLISLGDIRESVTSIAKDILKIRENTDLLPQILAAIRKNNSLANKGMSI